MLRVMRYFSTTERRRFLAALLLLMCVTLTCPSPTFSTSVVNAISVRRRMGGDADQPENAGNAPAPGATHAAPAGSLARTAYAGQGDDDKKTTADGTNWVTNDKRDPIDMEGTMRLMWRSLMLNHLNSWHWFYLSLHAEQFYRFWYRAQLFTILSMSLFIALLEAIDAPISGLILGGGGAGVGGSSTSTSA